MLVLAVAQSLRKSRPPARPSRGNAHDSPRSRPSANLTSAAPPRSGGRATPCLLVLLYLSRISPPSDASQCLQSCWRSIRRTASAGSSHDALKASALLAWPAMCDASPLCLRLVGRIRATATRRTGSAPRVFVTEPPQLDGRSQVGRSRRQGNDGLLAMGGGLASVVAAVLS